LHHDNAPSDTSFFTRDFFFTKNNIIVVPHPPYFSLFPQLKIQLKAAFFDTIVVIEAESQTVLNTLTEQDFQDAFKEWQKRCGAYTRKGTTSRMMVASKPEVGFGPHGSVSSEYYGWPFVYVRMRFTWY
jgi:hypothetical protein